MLSRAMACLFTLQKPFAALAALSCAGALAACASTPAPVTAGWPRTAPSPARPAPLDPNGPPRELQGTPFSQCVPFARQASGVEIYGDANTWWTQAAGRYPRSGRPAPGSVLVLRGYRDPSRGHVAVVSGMVSDRILKVDQANWLNRGEISLAVPVLDVSPENDWSQVRVWHIPSGQWGARIYEAEGFIHPFPLYAAS